LALLVCVIAFVGDLAWGKDGPIRDLSGGERAAIVAGSFGIGALAQLLPAPKTDSTDYLGYRANPLDRWWRERVHGGSGYRSNIVDHQVGSFIAPVAGGLTMALIDINRREFSRDIPLFVAGAVTTGAVTTAVKRIVRRPRPYMQDGGTLPPGREEFESYHTESFFSGHSSQAFFAAGFVNNRLRRHMRQQWRRDEYRSWRWASPIVTFGWASFVGWSRMHADKHHFTDVATGALVGYAISEAYYRMAYEAGNTSGSTFTQGTPLLYLSVSF
jgi:membrane-associated phospholipid phosphatase